MQRRKSERMPRWAMSAWLLSNIRNAATGAAAKLALFWDLINFNMSADGSSENRETFATIEPVIQILLRNLPSDSSLLRGFPGGSLWEFLRMIVYDFGQEEMPNYFLKGLQNAVRKM